MFVSFVVPSAASSPTPYIENDAVLGEFDAHFGGNFIGNLSRADTWNFMALAGPDFKSGFVIRPRSAMPMSPAR
jgi:hypothetical protein